MKSPILFVALFCLILHAKAQNYALNFDGTSQYINIPDQTSIELGNNFTIEGWIYPTGIGSGGTQGGIIVNKENSYEIARFADGSLQYALSANGTGGDWSWISSGLVAPLNTWSHFAFIKSGTSITMYLNSIGNYSVSSGPAMLAANTQPLRIANRTNSGQLFNGNMDEIRIWNTARTQAQIKTNMLNKGLANNTSGLIAYYRMNENAGSTTASSCTNTTGLTGTLVSTPSWSPSPIQFTANSLSFDGVDDVVTVPYNSSLDISTAITMEAWVYPTKNSGIQNVVSKSNITTNTGYIFPRTDDGWGNVVMYLHIGGWKQISAPYPAPLNAWHHLAATYDGANMKLYIDGILKTTIAQTGSIAVNGNALALGNQPGFSEFFGGAADEIRIWNVARTQAQIQGAMNAELDPSTQTGLVSYYTMNQGVTTGANTGLTIIPDLKGNNNGTMSNFSLAGTGSNFVAQFASLALLPVSWLSFTAQNQNSGIQLNWSTASEQNSASFIIQHSTDGFSWNNIGMIPAAGNSNIIRQYSFADKAPAAGVNYYRILLEDLDNKSSYSKAITLVYKKQQPSSIVVYPNPVTNGILHLQLQHPATVSVYNNNGALVFRKELPAGTQQLDISGLAKGGYQLNADGETVGVLLQ